MLSSKLKQEELDSILLNSYYLDSLTKLEMNVLVSAGANVNTKNEYGSTPLIEAAISSGSLKAIKVLISKGANPNIANDYGFTPLHYVSMFNSKDHEEKARILLDGGAKINLKDKKGNTPLHSAALNGRLNLAKLFLDRNANPYAKNNIGDTPIHMAVKNNYLDIAELLFDKKYKKKTPPVESVQSITSKSKDKT
jgi:ankyrin repeat protein